MEKNFNIPTLMCLAILLRILIVGSTISDSLIILGFCSLIGYYHFLKQKQQPKPNKDILDRLDHLEQQHTLVKDRVNSISFSSSIKR